MLKDYDINGCDNDSTNIALLLAHPNSGPINSSDYRLCGIYLPCVFKQSTFKLFKYFMSVFMLLSNYISSSNRLKKRYGGFFKLNFIALLLILIGSCVNAGSCPAGVTTSSSTDYCLGGEYLCGYSEKGCVVSFVFLPYLLSL